MNTTSKYFTRIKTFSCDEYTVNELETQVNKFVEALEIPRCTSIKIHYLTSGTGAGTSSIGCHRLFVIVEYKSENPFYEYKVSPHKSDNEDADEDEES